MMDIKTSTHQIQFLLSLLLLLLLAVNHSNGRPGGSPFSACASMQPSHGGIQARQDLSPYVVLVSQDSYQPGDEISIMLRGLCGINFMGFLTQARRADPQDPRLRQNPNEAIGTFSAVLGTRYECGDQSALTHNNRYNGTTLLFNWTAPATPQGHIQILSTFVQRFDSYWPQVASVVINDPSAPPLSVNPNDLRTPFITPCQIDRPTTPAPGVTIPATTPIPSMTTPNATMTTSAMMLETTMAQQQLTTRPLFTTTTPKLTDLQGGVLDVPEWVDGPTGCGQDRGCFRSCASESCDFMVMWKDIGDHVWFQIRAKQLSSFLDQYVAIAFSTDMDMGADSVIECMDIDGEKRIEVSYNSKLSKNEKIDMDLATGLFSRGKVSTADNEIRCEFARRKLPPKDKRIYDLDKDWYLLFAQGSADSGEMRQHQGLPSVSAQMVDLQSYMVVGPAVRDKAFIKIHACLMVLAWLWFCSIGTVIARFYKPLWPHKTWCKRKVWFTIHRMCMVTAGVLNIVSFVIIFLHVKGLTRVDVSSFPNIHPIIGIISTFFVLVQIVMGMFRPHAISENRPVFNWGHWLLGIITHVLMVFNMMMGVQLHKAGVHQSVQYLLYTYAAYQVIIVIVLEIIFCNIRIKVRKQQSYSIYEIRNAIYSSTKDILDATVSEPPGGFLLRVILFIHIIFITMFAGAIIAVIVFIDSH